MTKQLFSVGMGGLIVIVLANASLAQYGPGRGWRRLGINPPAPAVAATPLSEKAKTALVAMHDDEKLAHDVYVALSEKWNLPMFARIASAEERHMGAIKSLMARYGIDVPAADAGFADPAVAKLYEELVTQGSESQAAAAKVGALIEELDIKDLRNASTATEQADVKFVYENLERASHNHLRAFARVLAFSGEKYAAQHLEQEEFDTIADEPRDQPGRRGVDAGNRACGGNCPGAFDNGCPNCRQRTTSQVPAEVR
ncbi:MAG: DUF2202 domain-containing protein [Pirellulaceae bacterium]|nr:DUF2202 domain-containing protein [Planctomycetales bacterium]